MGCHERNDLRGYNSHRGDRSRLGGSNSVQAHSNALHGDVGYIHHDDTPHAVVDRNGGDSTIRRRGISLERLLPQPALQATE